jgi:hypothetical protein
MLMPRSPPTRGPPVLCNLSSICGNKARGGCAPLQVGAIGEDVALLTALCAGMKLGWHKQDGAGLR